MFIDLDLENIGGASGGAVHFVYPRQVQPGGRLRPFAGWFFVAFFLIGGSSADIYGGYDIVLSIVMKPK